jgi:RecJ-like exonuclease
MSEITGIRQCPDCLGDGTVLQTEWGARPEDAYEYEVTCPSCHGKAEVEVTLTWEDVVDLLELSEGRSYREKSLGLQVVDLTEKLEHRTDQAVRQQRYIETLVAKIATLERTAT